MGFFSYLRRAFEVTWIGVSHLSMAGLYRLLGRETLAGPDRLRIMLEEMSGSFLKFGQILSLQVDTLPRRYCDALLDLLDRVPPFPEEQVRQVFREELGGLPDTIFEEFDYAPIAAASIGQVHEARRKGLRMAVKVQRPGIREVFTRDAVLLNLFVKLVFLLRIRTLYFMRDPLREFNDWIQDELDYRTEAAYGGLLEKNSRETPSERVPKIHWELTTTRILTMDFLEGKSVRQYLRIRESGQDQELEELRRLGFDPPTFVSNVIRNFVSDALRFGVFHADLHPANLLIMRDNQVGYVDFGIVGNLTPEARRKIIQMTLGYVRGENDEIFNAFMAVSTVTEHADLKGFRSELERLSRRWYQEPALGGKPQFGRSITILMIDLLSMCRAYGVLPRREMIKYIRSLFLADGLVSRLAPGLDYGPHLQELCEAYLMEEAGKKLLSNRAALPLLADVAGWLESGPASLMRSLDLLERRELPFKVNLTGGGSPSRAPEKAFWLGVGWLSVTILLLLSWTRIEDRLADISSISLLILFGMLTASLVVTLWKLVR